MAGLIAVTSLAALSVTVSVSKTEENQSFVADIALPRVDSRTDFDALWVGVRDGFVLSDDGIVRVNPGVDEVRNIDQANYHIGNIHKAFPDPIVSMDIPVLDAFAPQGDTVIDDMSHIDGPEVPECGPSPLAADEIRRMVGDAARQYGVDPLFAQAVAYAESNFDRHRNSPKGARGPMQLTPVAAERFSVSDVCDPAANVDGGVRYLRALLDEFHNPIYAAAAYNAGAQRIYEYGGVPPFRETVQYLAKILNYQLGLPEPAQPPGAATASPSSPAPLAGVIQQRTPGAFVGGVMHF